MFILRWVTVIFLFVLATVSTFQAQNGATSSAPDSIQLTLNTAEAEAVLAILDKRAEGAVANAGEWHLLFATEPYIRLKKREASLHRDFIDADFNESGQEKLVLWSAELLRKIAGGSTGVKQDGVRDAKPDWFLSRAMRAEDVVLRFYYGAISNEPTNISLGPVILMPV